jgi:hypothetical protein
MQASCVIKKPYTLGTFWLDTEGDTSIITGFEAVTTSAGTFTDCMKIKRMNQGVICIEWYAPNVGMVKTLANSMTRLLSEYVANK